MKKVVFVFFSFFIFLIASPVFAAAPACDPTKVDMTIPITLRGGSQANCDSLRPGSIYCDSTSYTGSLSLVGGTGCWPKGPTTHDPGCAPGYYPYPADRPTVCCNALSLDPRECLKKENITPINYCQSVGNYDFVFDKNSGKCQATARTSVFLCLLGQPCETAIGNITINADLTSVFSFLLRFAFGIAGGIILLMLIITGYIVLTSSGNPEKLQAARENLVSIFTGIILIFFSLVLLNAIGASILKLPTF